MTPNVGPFAVAGGDLWFIRDKQGRITADDFHGAAARGDIEAIQRYLREEKDVNAIDGEGRTPLHTAAEGGYVEVIRALLAAGADVNAIDNEGRTPLTMAARAGHEEVVELLKRHSGTQ